MTVYTSALVSARFIFQRLAVNITNNRMSASKKKFEKMLILRKKKLSCNSENKNRKKLSLEKF